MSDTYLYRAVLTESEPVYDDANGWTDYFTPGHIIGRQTGYLSRSSAVENGCAFINEKGGCFEVVRSEPVKFPVTVAEDARINAGFHSDLVAVDAAEIAKAPEIVRAALDYAVTDDHLNTVAALGDTRKAWRFLTGFEVARAAEGIPGASSVVRATFLAGSFGAAFPTG